MFSHPLLPNSFILNCIIVSSFCFSEFDSNSDSWSESFLLSGFWGFLVLMDFLFLIRNHLMVKLMKDFLEVIMIFCNSFSLSSFAVKMCVNGDGCNYSS